jgi:prevent-host-death family protein
MSELSLAVVRNRLSELVTDVEHTHSRVTVTKHGHPAAVLVSPEDLESLEETLDILSTPGALDEIHEAERDIAQGETADESALRADLAARVSHADTA